MADLPEPRPYYIATPLNSGQLVWLAILLDDNELMTFKDVEKRTAFSLQYVDQPNGICMFSDVNKGGFLGVSDEDLHKDKIIRRWNEPKRWILKKADRGGFSMSQVLDGGEKYWQTLGDGFMVCAASGYSGIEGWILEPVDKV